LDKKGGWGVNSEKGKVGKTRGGDGTWRGQVDIRKKNDSKLNKKTTKEEEDARKRVRK